MCQSFARLSLELEGAQDAMGARSNSQERSKATSRALYSGDFDCERAPHADFGQLSPQVAPNVLPEVSCGEEVHSHEQPNGATSSGS